MASPLPVQVKHLSLSNHHVESIRDSNSAEQIIVVCKSYEAETIASLLAQLGIAHRFRGVITEKDLQEWYALACGPKYRKTIGKDLVKAIGDELALEFPLTQAKRIQEFLDERGYDINSLDGLWAMPEADDDE